MAKHKTKRQRLVRLECPACGDFMLKPAYLKQAKEKKRELYCPIGHEISYRGGSFEMRAKKLGSEVEAVVRAYSNEIARLIAELTWAQKLKP